MDWVDILNDHNVAVLGVITVVTLLIAYLFEKYMPIEDKVPKIIQEDDPNLKKTREELLVLEPPIKDLPMMTIDELAKHSGLPD